MGVREDWKSDAENWLELFCLKNFETFQIQSCIEGETRCFRYIWNTLNCVLAVSYSTICLSYTLNQSNYVEAINRGWLAIVGNDQHEVEFRHRNNSHHVLSQIIRFKSEAYSRQCVSWRKLYVEKGGRVLCGVDTRQMSVFGAWEKPSNIRGVAIWVKV